MRWGPASGWAVKSPPTGGAGEGGSMPGPAESPGEGNSNSLQCSCLGIPMDRGGWWARVMGSHGAGHDLSDRACTQARGQ